LAILILQSGVVEDIRKEEKSQAARQKALWGWIRWVYGNVSLQESLWMEHSSLRINILQIRVVVRERTGFSTKSVGLPKIHTGQITGPEEILNT
jgi:hypothetical protein